MTRRFPVVLVVATILKVIAIVMVLVSFYMFLRELPQQLPHMFEHMSPYGASASTSTDLWNRLDDLLSSQQDPIMGFIQGLISPCIFWVLAEIGLMMREQEFNTRRCVPAALQEAEPAAWEPPTYQAPPIVEPPAATPPAAG